MNADQQSGTDASRTLNADDAGRIGSIIATLEQSPFDFLELTFGDMRLTLGKGDVPPAAYATPAAPDHQPAVSWETPAPGPARSEMPAHEDTVASTAPFLGRFQARAEPGAPPFVTVGSQVHEDTTIGLIKALTTVRPVRAGIHGVVTEVCVEDAGFVEYGQVLMRIRPVHG